MKIAIMTDVHGNLPALEKALEIIRIEKCDLIYNLGDAIAIGPFPKECIETLSNIKECRMIMGNHEEYQILKLKGEKPLDIDEDEWLHQEWVSKQLSSSILNQIEKFPYMIYNNIEGINFTFLHYALTNNRNSFKDFIKNPDDNELVGLFSGIDSDIILYGHDHSPLERKIGNTLYLNVGSLGCHNYSYIRLAIIEIKNKNYSIRYFNEEYDKKKVLNELINRKVPARNFIAKAFFGLR